MRQARRGVEGWMNGSPDLAGLLRPAEGLGAFLAVAAAAGGRGERLPSGLGGSGDGPAPADRSAAWEDVEVVAVEVPWRELGRALPTLGPAVLRLSDPAGCHHVLLRRSGRGATAPSAAAIAESLEGCDRSCRPVGSVPGRVSIGHVSAPQPLGKRLGPVAVAPQAQPVLGAG
jgi:hypothetical protein